MINSIREYIEECPYLTEFTKVNVNYLIDKIDSYSVNEGVGYDPIISEDILGNEECQFRFTFDAKLYWNDEVQNNVDNSVFFENFSNWLRDKSKNNEFPSCDNNIVVNSIKANSNGYIFDTNSDEAIYRIDCIMNYTRMNAD